MLAVDPINVVVAGVLQSLARSGNVAEWSSRHASCLLIEGGGSIVIVFGGGN